jgi:outer membrane protein
MVDSFTSQLVSNFDSKIFESSNKLNNVRRGRINHSFHILTEEWFNSYICNPQKRKKMINKNQFLKKGLLLIAGILLISTASFAQKYAYVNTEYILENIPEYKTAQQQLDNLSITWQKEIEDKYAIIDKLYKAYQAEQVLLTEEMKRRRQDEITQKEKDVKDLQKQRFGYEGDLFKKKQELIKPIQDKIYNAVKKLATEGSYAVIFDKSSDLIMLYTNPKYDKSDDILTALGYKPQAKSGTGSGKTTGGTTGGGTSGGTSGGTTEPGKTDTGTPSQQPPKSDEQRPKQ